MKFLEMLKKDIEYANYTFQDAEETRDRTRLSFVPEHKANFGLNMGITKYINANLQVFVSGRRSRENGDTRGACLHMPW